MKVTVSTAAICSEYVARVCSKKEVSETNFIFAKDDLNRSNYLLISLHTYVHISETNVKFGLLLSLTNDFKSSNYRFHSTRVHLSLSYHRIVVKVGIRIDASAIPPLKLPGLESCREKKLTKIFFSYESYKSNDHGFIRNKNVSD